MKTSLLHVGAVSALFLLITILFTAPLILRMTTHIPGYIYDIDQYYWCHWWFGEAIERGVNPWWTDMQWHPNGTSLIFSTNRFVSAFLGWLITPIVGIIASYNIIILLSFVISALGVYLFIRELTGNNMASFAAAFIFTFNPWKFNKLQCHHFLMSTWFFGFALWMFLRILQGKGKPLKNGILLGVFTAITIYESVYLFNMLLLALGLMFVLYAVFEWKNFWRASNWKGFIAAGLAFLILALPMIVMIIAALPDYGSLPYAEGARKYSNDLLHLGIPSPIPWSSIATHPRVFFTENYYAFRTDSENFGPMGWVLIPLAIAGWWLGRRKFRSLADSSLISMLFFTVLSLGPLLHIGGKATSIPLPYAFLSWIPFIKLVRTPSRFMLVAFLFAGILAALAIAHIAQMKRWKRAWLLPALLVALIMFDYMPHGSATQDQRDYPKTMDAMAAVEGDFAVMPYGYKFYESMRYEPIYGKPMTTGYTSRNTLFARPVQEMTINLLSALLSANDKVSGSDRLAAMAQSTKTVFNAANIGGILHLGEEKRLFSIVEVLGGEILAREGEHSAILLPQNLPVESSLSIRADNWPPMPNANFSGSQFAEQLWTGFNGFRFAIPAGLMPEETLDLDVSSTVWDVHGRAHYLLVNVNREPVARIELSDARKIYTVRLPENIRRLPMNIFEITQEFGPTSMESQLPFQINALSGNKPAGNFSALYVNDEMLFPYQNRNASILVAALSEDGSAGITGEYSIHGDDFAAEFAQSFETALKDPWVVIITCGETSPSAAEQIETAAEKAGIHIDRRDIRGRSFVAVIRTKSGEVISRNSKTGYVHLINGEIENPSTPTVNIYGLNFH